MADPPVYEWQPTTGEIARRAGIPKSDVLRFDHNTSPFAAPWAPEVAAAAAAGINEYPPADYLDLRTTAGARFGLAPSRVVAGAGIDELILLCAKAFLRPGGVAVATAPGYPMYAIATRQQDARLVDVARRQPDFAFPEAEVVAAARRADLIWLCVPHNPTGRRQPDVAVESVLSTGTTVVIDAAYAEFCGDDWSPWLDRYHNLVVLHTMSKAFGLAGARVGYSLSSEDLAAALQAVRPPGSISSVSAALATRALLEPERAAATVAALTEVRTTLAAQLTALGLRVLPSTTNFLLCEVGDEAPAVAGRLLGEGLVVRSYRRGALERYVRITARAPDENDRLLEALARTLTKTR